MHQASCNAGRKLRFGMLTALTNIRCYGRWKTTFSGRRHSVEDNLHLKTTFSRKTTFSGRWPSVEGNLQWKTTFGGWQNLVEDGLWWKMTFGGRWPLMEDNLWWKTTFGGKRPLVEDDLRWKKIGWWFWENRVVDLNVNSRVCCAW